MNTIRRPSLLRAGSLLFALVFGCTGDTPTAPSPTDVTPPSGALTRITCVADVRAATVSCPTDAGNAQGASFSRTSSDVAGRSADLIVGKQGVYVTLTSSSVAYAGDVFSFNTTVKNLIPQALGTTDGASVDPSGVRVFFSTLPQATGGSGTIDFTDPVSSASMVDGTATFTASAQPYYQYNQMLAPNLTSTAKQWRIHVPASVSSFAFVVYVSAPVQFPNGWVDVTPLAPVIRAGQTATLSKTVRDVVGEPTADQTVTWGTSNASVATVDAAGVVTAVADGTATITATQGPRTGSATVTVSTPSAATTTISASPSTFQAGGSTTITVQVKNAAGANVTTGGDNVQLSSDLGSLTPAAATDNFNGTYTATLSSTTSGTAHVTGTLNGVAIAAANTATVTVTPAALHHFLVEQAGGGIIGTQTPGTPFGIRITAQDATNNTVSSFTGTVSVTSTGTLSAGGGTSAAFVGGVLSPNVTISNEGSWTITATRTGGSETGTSASFFVEVPPTVGTTTPANGATGVAVTSTITIPFSKSVTASASAFTLKCPSTGAALSFTQSASPTATFTLTPSASLPGGSVCQVTVAAAQITDANGFHMASDNVFSFTTALAATNDTYPQTVVGNVSVNSANVVVPYSVTNNDNADASVSVSSYGWLAATGVTEQGGAIVMATSGTSRGQFVYDPPAGFQGTDHFTYTLSNGTTTSAPATVSLQVSGMIWFIDNVASACSSQCGRLSHPFTSLAAFQAVNDGIGTHPAPGQNVFLFQSATPYTGPVTLLNNQKLIGQNATASLSLITGLTPPTSSAAFPGMNPAGPATTIAGAFGGVVLAPGASATLHGLTIKTTGGTALASSASFGTLGFSNASGEGPDVTIDASGGGAMSLTGGAVAGTLAGVSSTGGANGINLGTLTGSLTINSGALSGASGSTVNISGGSANITYAGSVAQTSGARLVTIASRTGGTMTLQGNLTCSTSCTGVSASGNSGGTITFSGPVKTLSTGVNKAVTLATNTGATINFTNGGLAINTTSGNGFEATGGGTVSVTGGGNTISSSVGTAVNVANTSIAAAGLIVQRISTTGGSSANGIFLSNTGIAGGLTVTGTGGSCTRSTPTCSGGTIGATSGSDGTTAGIGVYLANTSSPSLNLMRINGVHQNFGIYGTLVRGLTLGNVLMDGTYGDGGANEGTVSFDELSGSASVSNSYVANGAQNNFRIHNASASTTLNRITFLADTIGLTSGIPTLGNGDGLQVLIDAGTTNVTVQSSSFLGAFATNLHLLVNGGGSDIVVNGNVFAKTQPDTNRAFSHFRMAVDGANATTGNITYALTNNTLNGSRQAAIDLSKIHGQWTMAGSITGNTIGSGGVNSGAANGEGIRIWYMSQGKHKVLISGNTISQYNANAGISTRLLTNGTGAPSDGSMHLTIKSNTISNPGTTTDYVDAIHLEPGGSSSNDTYTTCVNLGNGGSNNLANGYKNATNSSGIPGAPYSVGPATVTNGVASFLKILGLAGGPYTGSAAVAPIDNLWRPANNVGAAASFISLGNGVTTSSSVAGGGVPCDLFP